MKITVLSWNIWQGKHFPEIIDFLRDKDADIVGLQEVIEKDGTNTAEEIAAALKLNHAYYQAINKTRLGHPQGNAILSKYPIEVSKRHFLSPPELYQDTAETEPRIAVEAKIRIGNDLLTVLTVHLAYSDRFEHSDMRDLQVQNLIKILPKSETILMGDFNSHPEDPNISRIGKVLANADEKPTEPTWTLYLHDYEGFREDKLRHRLDYIFASKDLSVEGFKIEQSRGSDHLPISAILSLKS